MTIRAIAADTFEDAPVDKETPKTVTRDGWALDIVRDGNAGEWCVTARKDGAVLDMRILAARNTHEVAEYVTEQIRGNETQADERALDAQRKQEADTRRTGKQPDTRDRSGQAKAERTP